MGARPASRAKPPYPRRDKRAPRPEPTHLRPVDSIQMARPRTSKGASGPAVPRTSRARGERISTDALLLRKVPYGEADLILTFFTEARGVVSAAARAARKSVRRFGAIEPLHLLRVTVEERAGAELGNLIEARLVRPRLG